jgi:amino acid transporter
MCANESTPSTQAKMRREWSFKDLYFAALTGVIGSGWIFGSYYTAGVAGPASIVSWIVGGVFILVIALTWAEVSGEIPIAGGVARYSMYTHGNLTGAFMAWSSLLPAIATPAVEAIAVISVVQSIISFSKGTLVLVNSAGLPTLPGFVLALLIALFFFWINYIGVRKVAYVNNAVGYIKLVILPLAIIFLIAAGLSVGLGRNVTTPSFAPYGFGPVFTALPATGVIFAYLGFRQPIDMAAESRNPQKDLWKAIVAVVGTTFVIYTLLQVAFIFSLQWNSAAGGTLGADVGDWHALNTTLSMSSMPFFFEFLGLGFGAVGSIIILGGIIGPSADTNQYYASTARIIFGLGREGYFPNGVTRIHQKYRVPVVGLLITLIVTIVLLVMGVAGSLVSSVGGAWTALTSIITSTLVFAYMAAPLSLPAIRKNYADLRRPFKTPIYKVLSPVAFVIGALLVYWGAGSLITSSDPYGGYILILIMLLGGIIVWAYKSEKSPFDFNGGLWAIVFLVFNIALLALGEYGLNLLPLPWDWVTDIVAALIFYYWSFKSSLPKEEIKSRIDRALSTPESE